MRPFWLLAFVIRCTPYQSVGFLGGYTEVRVNPRSYTVNFKGNGFLGRATAHQYALRRAAELTLQSGLDGFVVQGEANYRRPGEGVHPEDDVTITMLSAAEITHQPQGTTVYQARALIPH